jgi:sterol carrier protein 2
VAGFEAAPVAPQMFGNAGREHMRLYGSKPEHFAKIAEKNHRHSVNNPNSQFRDEYTLKQIQDSKMVFEPLTKLQCCPTSDGGAAAVLASEDFVRKNGLEAQAVEIVGMEMTTDLRSTFDEKSMIKMVGFDMTKTAAERLFKKSGLKPEDVDVIELHDCFSANELITYEALGLCPIGKAGDMVDRGDNTYGGKYVVNPSGGLISKGHPLGATGLAQCTELCQQLRGESDKRQVPNARLALQHNLGLGGAVVVALYRMGFTQGQNKSGIGSPELSVKSTSSSSPSDYKSSMIFEGISAAFDVDGGNLVKKVKGVFAFKVKGDNGGEAMWIVDAKNGKGSVEFNGKAKPDVTLTCGDSDLFDLMSGKMNAQKAFFQGKLKIHGNMGMAMKLQEFQKQAADKLSSAKL